MKNGDQLIFSTWQSGRDSLLDELQSILSENRRRVSIVCNNPHSQVTAWSQDRVHVAMADADYLLPDGIGMMMASRLLRLGIKERVTGPDLLDALHARLQETGKPWRIFYLGSTPTTLNALSGRMNERFPGLVTAGVWSPPFVSGLEFSPEANQAMIDAINQAKPDILWVGMTAPKQEVWVFQHRHRLSVPVIGCIGAAFDFAAGTKRRSGTFWRRLGLEWLPRLLREPRRMFRRNFVSNPLFILGILRLKIMK